MRIALLPTLVLLSGILMSCTDHPGAESYSTYCNPINIDYTYSVDTDPFIEGPWMTKYNDTYYLEYAAPGTQWNVYGDGVYTSDRPLGPFTYEEYSPFSYKPGGFIRGAGHGSTVQDPYDNYWHFATMVVDINFNFERRIGQFPAGFDDDGQLYTNTAYGDYPHYLPSSDERGREDWFTGWMLLSYDKPVEASSHQEDFRPGNAVDENVKTFWVANTNTENEWLTIDLEQEGEVRAIQINYTDYESNIFGKPDTLYHQYLIESSTDGENWDLLVDKRDNETDVPNDYVELASPQQARYIRFTNVHVPTPNLAISGLRVFGTGAGERPDEVTNFEVERGEDHREARLRWNRVEAAQGYHLYYGIDPDKLYNSVMVYEDTTYQLNGLNVDPDYFFAIEAFNENGISERSSAVTSTGRPRGSARSPRSASSGTPRRATPPPARPATGASSTTSSTWRQARATGRPSSPPSTRPSF